MEKVFIYWDNSNIFTSAQQAAIDQGGETARYGRIFTSAICWGWRTADGRLSVLSLLVPSHRSCGTSGIVWKTKA